MARISVCIPTYNSALYLRDAIESVLAQDCDDYELIVVDNASTDGTPEVCSRYGHPRMRSVRFDTLVGQAGNWNRCVELAGGDYVVLLHADDALLPAFLGRAAAVLDANPDVGLVHCCVRHVDRGGAPIRLQAAYADDRVDAGDVLLRRLLLEGCVVNPSGVMVRRAAYRAVGPFTEAVVWGVDWHMWARLALHAPVAYLAETLALYRIHPQSGTSGVMATARNGVDELWVIRDILRRVPAERDDLRALRDEAIRRVAHRTWCHAEEMCRLGSMRAARAGIRRALSIWPGMALHGKVWALWLATYVGYDAFDRVHRWRMRARRGALPQRRSSCGTACE